MSEAENATPNATPPAPKSKVVAGLLAIFLGGFGIHKFYLGYTARSDSVGRLCIGIGLILRGYRYSYAVDPKYFGVGRRHHLPH